MNEQEGRGDLADAAGHRPGQEAQPHRGHGIAGEPVQREHEEKREGKAETETNEGSPGGAHDALEVLLQG